MRSRYEPYMNIGQADESIPLSEEFLVKNVMQYFSYAKAKIVELYGDRKSGGWDGTSRYIGGIGAVVLEFESAALRDSFLKAIMPVCRFCGPEYWSQLVFAPMDGSGECYGICLEREKESAESPSRIFVVNLQCPSPIRFWAPTKYHQQHLWFADGTLN